MVYSFARGIDMAYEDIYKGLTEEEKQRMIKDEEEIESIQKACKVTDDCFEYILGYIKPGMTEKQIARDANLSEEEFVQAEQDLNKIIKRLRKRAKNKK